MTSPTDNTFAHQDPPQHHRHRGNDALPGFGGTAPPADYSTEVTNDPNVWKDSNERKFGAGTDTRGVIAGGQHQASDADADAHTHDAFHEQRPLGVQETSRGGVAIGGESELPVGKASMADKIVGKTQKVAGKAMHNPELHEKGELRETGGKAAVRGEARAAHD